MACWQTDAQWIEREVRDQLDALFAHRVYFATASVRDARSAVGLTMSEFSDTVRPGVEHLSALGHPDARLHLPRHHAIASWSTPEGRQAPFVAETIPLRVDAERVALHTARQAERGGRYRTDLSQPHWDRERREVTDRPSAGIAGGGTTCSMHAPQRAPLASPVGRTPGVESGCLGQAKPDEDRSAQLRRSRPASRSSSAAQTPAPAAGPGGTVPLDGYRELASSTAHTACAGPGACSNRVR